MDVEETDVNKRNVLIRLRIWAIDVFKYHISCTDGKISIASKLELPLFSGFTVVPFYFYVHSCRPLVVFMKFSAGLVGCRSGDSRNLYTQQDQKKM